MTTAALLKPERWQEDNRPGDLRSVLNLLEETGPPSRMGALDPVVEVVCGRYICGQGEGWGLPPFRLPFPLGSRTRRKLTQVKPSRAGFGGSVAEGDRGGTEGVPAPPWDRKETLSSGSTGQCPPRRGQL